MSDQLEVLLIEDDESVQRDLRNILVSDGHRVNRARCFRDVFEAGIQCDVSLVVLEQCLPDGDVKDALPELKRLLPNAEFVVVTGFADTESTITAFKLGVTDFLIKPVPSDVLRQTVLRIANQKNVEDQLQSQHRFANQVLDTAEAFILVLDLDGKVVRFNPYFTERTGWTLDALIGKDFIGTCIPEQERERVRQVFRATASGQRLSGVQNGVLTTDGRVRQVRWSDSTIKDERGNVESVLAIGLDVTDMVMAQEVAARSQRLAAIGQTVAGLAHESRNALHRINASVEILQLDISPNSDLREEVESIQRASRELQNTLEELRQFAAPICLHREEVMLPEVWRRVWSYLEPARRGRDTQLTESHCGCECAVDVDVLRIEQVFRNLFENALAACEDPVRIHLNCECDGADSILLDIEDNGPGLSEEQRNNLFDPFFTTKSRGTGLGLSIVQRIVDAHGGQVSVADPRGCGARFLIRLSKLENRMDDPCPRGECFQASG
ncbi:MAG: ATP-binding protein [Planctomycetota bacterium]